MCGMQEATFGQGPTLVLKNRGTGQTEEVETFPFQNMAGFTQVVATKTTDPATDIDDVAFEESDEVIVSFHLFLYSLSWE